ncbi:hypothetical protein SLEP1_g10659 [Rubroshorea leprosula]|uniref:Uncharacterized protein n=1 Tax=Rubroshorea leprosula TaxID=152421 RepID=A0AAV5IHA1_9ROSI|nr:hypothetical protein SLEP1_g10659 [Rubroshorea leprosula]
MAGPLAWTASKVGGLGNGGNESKMTGESQSCSPPEARAAKSGRSGESVIKSMVKVEAGKDTEATSSAILDKSMEETVEDLWVRGVKIWGKALKLASPGT